MSGDAGDREQGRQRVLSRSSRFLLAVTVVLIGIGVISVLFPRQAPVADGSLAPKAFDLQGHRGAKGLLAENSLPSFEKALALGVTTLELDTLITADGVIVVHHDRTLAPERTRDAVGSWLTEEAAVPLIELRHADLEEYDIGRAKPGSRVAERFPQQVGMDNVRIPALAETLTRMEALSGGRIRYSIEAKPTPVKPELSATPEVFVPAILAVIREAGVSDRVTIQSFDWHMLRLFQEQAPEIETGYLTVERRHFDTLRRGKSEPSPWLAGLAIDWSEMTPPAAVKAAGGSVWSPFFRNLTKEDLKEAQHLGLRVVVWTVNDPETMASLIDLGVDGIVTDYPDRALEVMRQKGMTLPQAFPGP